MADVKDLCVVVGTYKDKNGDEKKRYETVGSYITKDDGGKFLKIKATFNPAGAMTRTDDGYVFLSLFDQKPKEQRQSSNSYDDTGHGYKSAKQAPVNHSSDVLDDDIPF
jgi:hypothetical protein